MWRGDFPLLLCWESFLFFSCWGVRCFEDCSPLGRVWWILLHSYLEQFLLALRKCGEGIFLCCCVGRAFCFSAVGGRDVLRTARLWGEAGGFCFTVVLSNFCWRCENVARGFYLCCCVGRAFCFSAVWRW